MPDAPADGAPAPPAGGAAEIGLDASPAPRLRDNRDFQLVMLGQGISALGSAISFTALQLLVVSLTRSGLQLGVVGLLETLPAFVFCLFAGALADRWDRRRILIYGDVLSAALAALVPIAMLLGVPAMPVIYLVAAPLGVVNVLFMAAYTAGMVSLVGRENVGAANAYHQVVVSLGAVIGPGLAGVLMTTVGPVTTLLIDSMSFLVAAGATALVRRRLQGGDGPGEEGMLGQIWAGITLLARSPLLRLLVAFFGAVLFVTAPIVPAVTFRVTVELGYDAGVFGALLSAYSVGNVVGYAAGARITRGRLGLVLLGANLGFAASAAALAAARSTPALIAAAAATGVFGALTHIPYITLRTTYTPDAFQGRVSSTTRMLNLGLQPLGLVLGGLLVDRISGGATLLLIGGLCAAITLSFGLSATVRGARPAMEAAR